MMKDMFGTDATSIIIADEDNVDLLILRIEITNTQLKIQIENNKITETKDNKKKFYLSHHLSHHPNLTN